MVTVHNPSSCFSLLRVTVVVLIACAGALALFVGASSAQKRHRQVRHLSVCGNPSLPCQTTGTFKPYDLPFRLPANAIIYDTELFYAVVLTSVSSPNDSCDVFVPERQRLAAQALFPDHKVFSSRCTEPGELSYSSTNNKTHFMAVYAGSTLAEANRMLAAVKATSKFPAANLRRMRATVNGT
jgi:hypothetical protein